jgi:hypothetical protein
MGVESERGVGAGEVHMVVSRRALAQTEGHLGVGAEQRRRSIPLRMFLLLRLVRSRSEAELAMAMGTGVGIELYT